MINLKNQKHRLSKVIRPLVQAKITSRKDETTKTKKRRKKKERANKLRGKEVSVSSSVGPGQIIYGRFRVGGLVSFIETNGNSYAYVAVGTGNSKIAAQAKTPGILGNNYQLEITVSGTHAATSVVGLLDAGVTRFIVRLRSSGGTPLATASEVAAALRADAFSGPRINANIADGDGTGVVAAIAPTPFIEGGGTWLFHVHTIACHEIDAIENLYLDNRQVIFGATPDSRWGTGIWSGRVFMSYNFGTDGQTALPDLVAQRPGVWTESHLQAGNAHALLITVWDQNVFGEGSFPEAQFLVRGKKVYDPRLGYNVWSQNAALIIADYLSNSKYGLGVSYSDIDTTTLTSAADTCDETVSSEARYTINGVFDTDQSADEVLSEMSAAIGGGDIVFQGGKWYIYPAKFRTPTKTYTEADLRSAIQVNTSVSRSELFNSVRGQFIDAANAYAQTDYPPVKNSTWITDDGQAVFEDLNLTLVISHKTAQRIAKIELERVRQGITINFQMHLGGLELQVADVIQITNTMLGWSAKQFEVRDLSLDFNEQGVPVVSVSAKETAARIFDWANGEETTFDPAPNTNLPTATDSEAPQGVILTSGTNELYFRYDGTVFSRLKVSWNATNSIYVREGGQFEIQFKLSSASAWSQSFLVNGDQTFHYILDVADSLAHDVRIRSINSLGYKSEWVTTTGHIVVGKTAPPSNVTGFTAQVSDGGILFSWNAISDIDKREYEIRIGSTWASGTRLVNLRSDGTSYPYRFFTPGSYVFKIKAIDTSGNYSAVEASQALTLAGPGAVLGLTGKALNSQVLIDWEEPAPSTFSVQQYEVRRGSTFEGAVLLGNTFGSFFTYLETESASYVYWVTPIDIGGNRGTQTSITIKVQAPSNLYVGASSDPIVAGTNVQNTFCIIGGSAAAPSEASGTLFFPVGKQVRGGGPMPKPEAWVHDTAVWAAWMTANSYTTFQDAVTALVAAPLSPNPYWPGVVEYKVDYGSVQPNAFIQWSFNAGQYNNGTGAVVVVPTISTSPDDVTYTPYVGALQVFTGGFRYVKYKLNFQAENNNCIVKITNSLAKLILQTEDESGVKACLAADAGGTTVTLTKSFLSINKILLTAKGTVFTSPVYDFNHSTVNPTTFKILLFDATGARMNGDAGWEVTGPINP